MEKFSVVDWIIQYESEDMDEETVISGFKYLIKTGIINSLQGSYQRMARNLIEQGLI